MTVGSYSTWRSSAPGSIIYIPYKTSHPFTWETTVWNAEYAYLFFNNYWHYSIYFAIFYVLGIAVLQRYMKNKKPLNLRSYLIAWNVFLALFSIMGTYRMGEEFVFVMKTRSFEDSVCLAMNPDDVSTLWACSFVLSKVIELVDTVFLLFKKKPVIFLHWYHHAIVLVYCWHAAVILTAASRWFIFMNYAVHSLMYTYYALAAYGIRFPRIISMSITTLQTVQMLVGVFISCYIARVKWFHNDICHQTDNNLMFCFGIYISFAILFINFFVKSYMSKKSLKKKEL